MSTYSPCYTQWRRRLIRSVVPLLSEAVVLPPSVLCKPLESLSPFLFFIFLLLSLSFPGLLSARDYVVGEGDVIEINVYDNDDLNKTVRISSEGTISMPLIGTIRAAGLTVSGLSKRVTDLYADGYLVNPQVTVFIKEFRSKTATVLGEVNRGGLHEIQGNVRFLEVISKAGGFRPSAGNTVIVKRKGLNGKTEIIKIDLKQLVQEGDSSQDILIKDGDSIFVKKAHVVYVSGEVRSSGAYRYEKGLTIIKAVTIAGGFTERASATNVKIIRKVKGREVVLKKVKMDKSLLPDDIIVVPESFF